jgi:type IV pilus assembly protein PilQ
MRASAGVNAPEAESAPTPMSLDVQNADVRTVFRSIAQFAGVNIVADNNVSGTVTIRALDLPWRGMLEAVCRSASLVVIEDGPVMRVATQRTAQEEALARESSARKQEEVLPLETRVLRVRYANAEELQETLGKIVSERGQVEVDARTNTLIVTDIAPRLESLEAMVQRLDTETVQVEIMAKIVDVDATVARQLGITWGASGLQSPGAHASGSLAIGAGEVAGAAADVQVGFLRSFGEIEARLQALEDERQAEIVSAPRITTVDNRMARILVGKQVPLITQDFAGNAITELKKVGIALEVTPHINADNQITMDLHPEISDLASATSTQGGIIFTTTEAETRVLVGDGETAVIGGLMRHGELTSKRGVPLLKDIPLLGRLFRSSERRMEKRELLIFVTPRIVKSAAR